MHQELRDKNNIMRVTRVVELHMDNYKTLGY